jgi:hypothetical protein
MSTETLTPSRSKRRWLTFSMRTLLIVMTLICVGIGWKMNQVWNVRRVVAEIQRLGGVVTYVHELGVAPLAEPPGPKWLRRIAGDIFFEEVAQVQIDNDQANDETLGLIAKLPRIESLMVTSNAITDDGLASLADASKLIVLELQSAKVTPSGYLHLKGLRNLKTLVFRDNNKFNDSCLPEILKLTQVHYFYLSGSQITDAGLVHLREATGLQLVELGKTNVTEEGVDRFQEAHPDCQVLWP